LPCKEGYDLVARWILAGAVALGWLLGMMVEVSEVVLGMLFAFLSGGVILNVLKEALPEERKSRFLPFAGGVMGYAALLILAS
jgi:zinc transporter ZupT